VQDYAFQSLSDLSQAFPELKRKKMLHPTTEKRLALLLKDIYPEAYPKSEPGEIPGGRSDLAFYFGNGRYVMFEVFATVSQVAQDLRHLEQSNAQARIAILADDILDQGAVFEEYFGKRPRDPFPWVRLSEILVTENETTAKKQLKQIIDEAFDSDSVSSELIVDITSRLEEFNLRDISDPKFGATKLTKNLYQFVRGFQRSGLEIGTQAATSSTMFLGIPTTPLKSGANVIFKVARELFDSNRWYDRKWVEKKRPGFRYYAYRIFPLENAHVRTEQKEVVVEEKFSFQEPEKELLNFVLRINEFGEVSFATSIHTVDQFKEGIRIFRLGAIIHLFWSFLCLIREFQESIGYNGNNHVCIAMVNTEGSHLGHFAEGWPDPHNRTYWNPLWSGWKDEVCRSPNVLVCRNTDLSTLEWKVEPEIIYDVAEEIARAYNQPEARCFDKQTRKLPDSLWVVAPQ